MCRNIRILHNFAPPATAEEIRAAALQYVRKVSGMNKPSRENAAAFTAAVDEVAGATERLLGELTARGATRTRELERERARQRFERRARDFSTGRGE
ncbi:MAG: DUF2277 domain-containing protein [Acidobacteria bacterium]|nr:DUF2277 domain-containing protein [Acidobacteriota bacterium]